MYGGIDAYVSREDVPETMIQYRTGGTPCIAVIDQRGILRFKRLGSFDVATAERLIESLLAEDEGSSRSSS